jgi:hypothetical protein
MPPLGFESTIAGSKRPQTHAFNRSATGIGFFEKLITYFMQSKNSTSSN